MNALRKIIILTTGGTIEKTYDEFDGSLSNRETILKNKILNKLRLPYTQVIVKGVLCKDSLYMDDQDRDIILQAINTHSKQGCPILVLHGTDTMEVTGKYCYEKSKASVPVVFTGSMKPMGFDDSDALQNFVEAMHTAFLVKPGYYISFHGRVFKCPDVRKNKEKRTFEST